MYSLVTIRMPLIQRLCSVKHACIENICTLVIPFSTKLHVPCRMEGDYKLTEVTYEA